MGLGSSKLEDFPKINTFEHIGDHSLVVRVQGDVHDVLPHRVPVGLVPHAKNKQRQKVRNTHCTRERQGATQGHLFPGSVVIGRTDGSTLAELTSVSHFKLKRGLTGEQDFADACAKKSQTIVSEASVGGQKRTAHSPLT